MNVLVERVRDLEPEAPPWNVIFRTAEEFDKADRASRLVKAESLTKFCRAAILERADDLLVFELNFHGLVISRTRSA